ncbi:MAG: RluA family pseudouridine synthase [Patescibacteria group bacterium]
MEKYKIKKINASQRLDKFLTNNLEDITRSQIQKLIKAGDVLVNEKKVSSHYKLKEGDVVAVEECGTDKKLSFGCPKLSFSKKIKDDSIINNILVAEASDYLVINKPAGLIVHGAEHIKEYTLVDWLMKKYPKIRGVGEDLIRPGIVHRLDKEVGGLMVVAKTQESFNSLKKQFQKRKVKKEYIALVYGKIEKESDEINFPIKRSNKGYKMAAIPAPSPNPSPASSSRERGAILNKAVERDAITEFEVEKKYINYTLLKVKIKTGRTHQIRVHMLAYGHPVVGDELYSTKRTREKNAKINLGRVFLVASRLSFYDLKNELQNFKIDLPKELKVLLKKVK